MSASRPLTYRRGSDGCGGGGGGGVGTTGAHITSSHRANEFSISRCRNIRRTTLYTKPQRNTRAACDALILTRLGGGLVGSGDDCGEKGLVVLEGQC